MSALDGMLFAWLNGAAAPPWLDAAARALTLAGDARVVWLWLLLAAVLAGGAAWRAAARAPRRRRLTKAARAAAGLLALAGLAQLASSAACLAAKQGVQRPRPFVQQAVVLRLPAADAARLLREGSMPSGHAANAFVAASVLARRARWRRWRALLYAAAGAVALSRVFLGVHYPADVLAGAALGWAVAALVLAGGRAGAHLQAAPERR